MSTYSVLGGFGLNSEDRSPEPNPDGCSRLEHLQKEQQHLKRDLNRHISMLIEEQRVIATLRECRMSAQERLERLSAFGRDGVAETPRAINTEKLVRRKSKLERVQALVSAHLARYQSGLTRLQRDREKLARLRIEIRTQSAIARLS